MKKVLLPIALLIIAAGGAYAYNAGMLDSVLPQREKVGQQNQKNQQQKLMKTSPQDLLAMNKKQKCEWEDEEGNRGVVYTDGEKVRIDMSSANQPEQGQSSVINDTEWMYIWNSNSDQGQKYPADEFEEQQFDQEETGEPEPVEEEIDTAETYDRDYEMSCSNWKVDQSKFVPPESVTFEDMSVYLEQMEQQMNQMEEQMNQMEEQSQQVQEQLQSADFCNQLTGEAKQKCLEAAGQ